MRFHAIRYRFISFLIPILWLSCNTGGKPNKIKAFPENNQAISITNPSNTDSTSKTKHNYIDESFPDFLSRISISDNLKKIKCYLTKPNKSNSKTFRFINGKDNITLIETYDSIQHAYVCEKLFVSGLEVNQFKNPGGKLWDIKGMFFGNSVDADTILCYLYLTPVGKFFLLTGSTLDAADQYMSNIDYDFLVPLDTPKNAVVILSYNLPGYVYLGYKMPENRIFYLNIPVSFSLNVEDLRTGKVDSGEFEYLVKADYLENIDNKPNPISDKQGNVFYIKLAIPSENNFTGYRIIDSYWWQKLN